MNERLATWLIAVAAAYTGKGAADAVDNGQFLGIQMRDRAHRFTITFEPTEDPNVFTRCSGHGLENEGPVTICDNAEDIADYLARELAFYVDGYGGDNDGKLYTRLN